LTQKTERRADHVEREELLRGLGQLHPVLVGFLLQADGLEDLGVRERAVVVDVRRGDQRLYLVVCQRQPELHDAVRQLALRQRAIAVVIELLEQLAQLQPIAQHFE
jgi:hypothetical protein